MIKHLLLMIIVLLIFTELTLIAKQQIKKTNTKLTLLILNFSLIFDANTFVFTSQNFVFAKYSG